MALVAQFIGEEKVAQMSNDDVERIAELIHADFLRRALGNEEVRKEIGQKVDGLARIASGVRAQPGKF